MTDRFEELRTLLTVASSGGINAAASELGIAKSAVSRRLSDLERRLGASLVDRSRRRFALTEAGRSYVARAGALMSSLDELDSSFANIPERPLVRIRAATDLATHIVVPWLESRSTEPGSVDVRLLAPSSDGRLEREDLLIAETSSAGKAGRALFPCRLVFCAAPDYVEANGSPRDPEELVGHAGILIAPASGWQTGGTTREVSRLVVSANDATTALAAAVAGLGIAQLPDYVTASAVAEGRLTRLLVGHEPSAFTIGIGHHADAEARVLQVADELAATLRSFTS